MAAALGLISFNLDFGVGLGVGLVVAVLFYVLKQLLPWEYQRARERRAARQDLHEELWFYLDRGIRQWVRLRDRSTDNPGGEWEVLLAREAHSDLEAALKELTEFLQGGAGTLDRDEVREIDEACTQLREVCLGLGQDAEPARREELEVRGDEVCRELTDARDAL